MTPKPLRPLLLTKLMVRGRRAPVDRTPGEVGLEYEDVSFAATDGVGLRGWFIPRSGEGNGAGPAVAFVHGWLWNRLGNVAGKVPWFDRDVDFLPATRALHDAGYHVLLFDLRNHGESESKPPISYGQTEYQDYCGAIGYLRGRSDVDGERIGVLGTSMGGATAMYGTPHCQPVRALLAVQPSTVPVFTRNFALTELGRAGPALVKPVGALYALMRAPLPRDHAPAVQARDLGDTVVKYVQGTGDQWGTMEDVEAMSAATPNSLGVLHYPSTDRYAGYRYVNEEVDEVAGFFREHL